MFIKNPLITSANITPFPMKVPKYDLLWGIECLSKTERFEQCQNCAFFP
jgi:hypothetical protein